MSSVPKRAPIDRTVSPYKGDPLIARLTDEQIWELAEWLAGAAASYAERLRSSDPDAYAALMSGAAEAES